MIYLGDIPQQETYLKILETFRGAFAEKKRLGTERSELLSFTVDQYGAYVGSRRIIKSYDYISTILVPTYEDVCDILLEKCSPLQAYLISSDLYYFLFNYLSHSPVFDKGPHYYNMLMGLNEFALKENMKAEYDVSDIFTTYFRECLLNVSPIADMVLSDIVCAGDNIPVSYTHLSPFMILVNVVLPLPERPTSTTHSPCLIVRFTL